VLQQAKEGHATSNVGDVAPLVLRLLAMVGLTLKDRVSGPIIVVATPSFLATPVLVSPPTLGAETLFLTATRFFAPVIVSSAMVVLPPLIPVIVKSVVFGVFAMIVATVTVAVTAVSVVVATAPVIVTVPTVVVFVFSVVLVLVGG